MERFGVWAAAFFWVVALYWGASMITALVTDSGDYKFDSIMAALFLVASLQALNLARRR